MSRPDDPQGRPAAFDETLDAPPADKVTARRDETSVKSAVPQSDVQTGEFLTDPSAHTGQFTPRADASSVTGGYTPSDLPKPAGPGDVRVRGYEVLGELGRGGMGVVYKAKQVGLDRLVALKMILAGAHARQKDLERFRAEAQAVARFHHPNIVQIYEVGEADGLPFFSLEFVDGGTLSGKIAREPQPPRYAAETMEALARAMQYAHERNVVHRDLKPANVLVATDGTPKITDFGLAKRLEQDSGQTQAGTVLGTPSYMAPEQATGDTDKVGPLADVYSLGAMFYDMLTGRPPFSGSSVLDTLEMVRTREPVPPGQLTNKLPRDLETICLKCLQKEPHKRYASAGELADDLRRYLEGKPILARPVGAVERTWRWAKRNPWVAGLGAATAVSLVAVALITSVMSYQINEKKKDAEKARFAAEAAEKKEAEQKQVAVAAKDVAEKKQQQSIRMTGLGLDVVRGISVMVDDKMKNKQSLADLRLDIQTKMLSDLDKLRKEAEENPLFDRGEAVALAKMGKIYLDANRVTEAEKCFRQAQEISRRYLKENPDDPVGPANLAAVNNLTGDTALRVGYTEEARDLYAEALELRKTWHGMLGPDKKPLAQRSIATSYMLLGKAYLQLGEPAKALENFQTSEQEYGKLPANWQADRGVRRDRALLRDQMAECQFKLGQSAEADRGHKAALKDLQELAEKYKSDPDLGPLLKRDVAFAKLLTGDFYLFDTKDVGRAVAAYAPSYQEVAAQAQADPDDLSAKRELAALAYRMGFVADRLAAGTPIGRDGLRQLSRSYYDECLALRQELAKADPRDTHLQIDVLVAEARLGRADEVAKGATTLLKQAGADRFVLFHAACALAIAGGCGTGPAADDCRKRAFEVLATLIEKGWKDRVGLETDPDLEAVRGDKRFQELVAKLPRK